MFYFKFKLFKDMKSSMILAIIIPAITMSFILSYVYEATIPYWAQYFALFLSITLNGLFGILNGIKREGFVISKAMLIGKTLFTWVLILTTILVTEKAFPEANWLSETFVIPVITFMLISALKNASQCGFIKAELLNKILENIDKHKNISNG